jgi:fumarylpyruvate hydrolase
MATTPTYLWTPPPPPSLPVRGRSERLPVHRLFFVGRNYHAHAHEMGRPVDKATARPFYFTKSPQTLVQSGATAPYPAGTEDYQHEMELVLVIGEAGHKVPQSAAHRLV